MAKNAKRAPKMSLKEKRLLKKEKRELTEIKTRKSPNKT